MKRTSTLLGMVAASAMLAACGGGGETSSESNQSPSAATQASEAASTAANEAAAATETAASTANEAMADAAEAAEETAADAEAAAGEAMEDATETASAEEEQPSEGGVTFASLTGDAAAGRRVFLRCSSCHVLEEGVNRVGPSLYGIFGREAGTVEGFRYSDANANSGLTWTKQVMFEYLEDPQEYIPGTYMAFPGLPDAQDRANVIAYIAENGGDANAGE